jgi:D-alanine-D-alanine ligase
MRVDAGGCPRVLDVNTSPGMTETSDLPAQAAHVGIDYADLVLEVLGSALVRAGLISAEEWR